MYGNIIDGNTILELALLFVLIIGGIAVLLIGLVKAGDHAMDELISRAKKRRK